MILFFILLVIRINSNQIQIVDYNEPSISAMFLSIDTICNTNNAYQQNTDSLIGDLTNYFNNCSRGKMTLSPQSVLVKGVILPCSGNSTNGYFDANTACGVNELFAWGQLSQAFAMQRNINIHNYKHFILLLPQMSHCNWGGLATMGPCIPNCFVWINGVAINTQSAFLHELGHNFGLYHAATYGNDYGDTSCALGAYASNRCYNVMSQARLNWNVPVQILQLNQNQFNRITIPSSLFSASNYVVLTLNSSDSLLISFRTGNIGYDKNLYSMYVNRLSIHHVRGLDAVRAYLVFVLPAQSIWNGQAYFNGLIIAFTSFNMDMSYVEIKTGIQSIPIKPSPVCGDHICHIEELYTCLTDCPFIHDKSTPLNYC